MTKKDLDNLTMLGLLGTGGAQFYAKALTPRDRRKIVNWSGRPERIEHIQSACTAGFRYYSFSTRSDLESALARGAGELTEC